MNKELILRIIYSCFIGVLGCSLVSTPKCLAQDPNFSQFYVTPTFLNPAFVGTTPHYRLASIYRNQWPGIPRAYETNIVSFEYNWDYYHSGIGMVVSNDRVLEWGYQSTTASILYAYEFMLDKKKFIRMGLQAGYVLRSYGFDKITFGDQIANGGGLSAEGLGSQSQGFVDIGFGALYYSERFWAGVSAGHLTAPSLNLQEGGGSDTNYLPMLISAHWGMKVSKKRKDRETAYWQPAMVAYWQGLYGRADVGMNFAYLPILVGVWYRNINLPNSQIQGLEGALTLLAGYKKGYITVAYSYDLVGGDLQGQTGGGHEISLTLTPNKDYRYKGGSKWGNRFVECPIKF